MEYNTDVKALECECSNSGVAVYAVFGKTRNLADLVGDFQRGEGGDPPIICECCGRSIPTSETVSS
jgi:hypothetical protein